MTDRAGCDRKQKDDWSIGGLLAMIAGLVFYEPKSYPGVLPVGKELAG